MNKKAKEPFMGMLLSIMLPGAGEIYAARPVRGVITFILTVSSTLVLLFHFLQPEVKISSRWYIPFSFPLLVYLLGAADSYIQVSKYNLRHKLSREIRPVRIIVYILGILSCLAIVNPVYVAKVFVWNKLISSYSAPPDSMAPAIYEGERVFVDLWRYKKTGLQRGDVFVYRFPGKPGKVFMHRIVGLPGESIELKGQSILINGVQIKEPWSLRKRYYNRGKFGKKGSAVTVPQDSYYVLGDYSAGSNDSRFWGFLPQENLIGRVIKIYYPYHRSGKN